MRFVILMAETDHHDRWEAADDATKARVYADFAAFDAAVTERGGSVVGGEALDRGTTARTLLPGAKAEREVVEGPYAEVAEQLGGYFVIEAPDLDAAVELARLLPREYHLEVRPVVAVED